MQALCGRSTTIHQARAGRVVARATPHIQIRKAHTISADNADRKAPFLAATLSALLAVNMIAAPLVQPMPANAIDNDTIKERAAARREQLRQARLKAEQGEPEKIPCVNIGCYSDSDEAAAQRKKEAEARADDIKRQAQKEYEQQRERKERNFAGIEAKSSFTGEQESLLKERIKNAEQQAAKEPSEQQAAPARAPPLRALQGAGIFGSSEE